MQFLTPNSSFHIEKRLLIENRGLINIHRLFMFFCLSLTFLIAQAQYFRIEGEVYHGLFQEGLAGAKVKLLSADGKKLIAADSTRYQMITERGDKWENSYPDKLSGAVFSFTVSREKEYLLVIEAKGFEPYRTVIEPEEGKDRVKVHAIYLMPLSKDRQLGEAVVKGTKIKMFYKGDTLVYNADAFNVTQTESLRKLVEQLPGAELTDGEIRINGKRVDNLLLSGKDFFNGNIQAALDNLPAFIVKHIKVYDKAGETTELMGRDMHDESYVMDVQLKRQYIGTWMAKLSLDGGTDKLWGGQGFLMRFDDRQMFTVNADVNNFNEDRQMMEMCNTGSYFRAGQVETKTARLSYYYEPNDIWRFRFGGYVNRKDEDKQTWTNSETYLQPRNLMTRNAGSFDNKEVKIKSENSIRARRKGRWQHTLDYNFDYQKGRSVKDTYSLSYYLPALTEWTNLPLASIIRLEEEKAEANALINSLTNPELNRSRNQIHETVLKSSFVCGNELIEVTAPFNYQDLTGRTFSNYRLTTYADNARDERRRYLYRHDYSFRANPQIEWTHKYERVNRFDGVIKPFVGYIHHQGTANHPEYRLERLTEWSGQMGWEKETLGRLPEGEWKSLCLDEANSYYSTETENKAEAGIRFSHKIQSQRGSTIQLSGEGAGYYQHRTLDYQREGNTYSPIREGFFFRPNLSLKWKRGRKEQQRWQPEWEAEYQGRPSLPALTQLLSIRDNSDPLNLFVGNENLGNSYSHQVRSAYRIQGIKSGMGFNISSTYRRLHNDIATQSYFDAATGIRTYQPINTRRTHSWQGRSEFSMPLGKKRIAWLSASLSVDYYQAARLTFLTDEAGMDGGLLRNIGFTPNLSLRANMGGKFTLNSFWTTSFRYLRQPGMDDHYRETQLWCEVNYTLPWQLQLYSLLSTRFYAGNSLPSLNQTKTRWDVSLSKNFFNDKLGLTFRVHDLLNQANTYYSEITPLGRTESYTDVLPRYFMLSLNFQTNWARKRKTE